MGPESFNPESSLELSAPKEPAESGIEREKASQKDVLFFDPPIRADKQLIRHTIDDAMQGQEIPKGAHSIATFLESRKVPSAVIPLDPYMRKQQFSSEQEFDRETEKLVDRHIRSRNPRMVGFDLMYTFTEPTVLTMTRYSKSHFPDKPVIVGGNHATFSSDFLLDPENETGIDVVVRGEGEWTSRELARELEKSHPNLSRIKGISYRDKDGQVVHNSPRDRGELRQIPPLDYSLVQTPEGVDITQFNHNVMFTRACKGNCAFCTSPKMWTREISETSVRNFQSEINFLIDQGVRDIAILDDDILVTPHTFEKIAPVLVAIHEKNPEVSFLAQTRVDRLRDGKNPEQILKTMKRAGVKRLLVGIESGSQQILDEMKKGIRTEWIPQACRNIHKAGIEAGGFWLFGHPGATPQEEEKSLKMMEDLLREGLLGDVESHITVPFPGTTISKDPRIRVFDHNKKHYGVINNQPVYDLVDPETGKMILSATQMRGFLDRALDLRKKYLGVGKNIANKPLERGR